MKPKYIIIVLSLVILGAVHPGPICAEENGNDILIIANKTVPWDKIKVKDLKEIFLKRRTEWENGSKVVPVNAPEGSGLRADFRKYVLAMSANEEHRFWRDIKIKTALSEPVVFASAQRAVFSLKRSVSYVYRSDYKEGVSKVLLIIPTKTEAK